MYKSTKAHLKYWQNRKIDWKQAYFDTWDHPNRKLIIEKIKKMPCGSLFEVGCASGPNLHLIHREFPQLPLGGIDPNTDAIATAKQLLDKLTVLDVGNANKIFLGDKSVDVILSDMALIYIDPFDIRKALKDIKRIVRQGVIFVEFHSSSFFKRLALRLASGYHAYDYRKLLENAGFYDIIVEKLEETDWPGGEPQKTFGYIITARV